VRTFCIPESSCGPQPPLNGRVYLDDEICTARMTRSIDSSSLASVTGAVEFEIPVHVASGTGLVQGVGSETVAQFLQLLTLPHLSKLD